MIMFAIIAAVIVTAIVVMLCINSGRVSDQEERIDEMLGGKN